MSLWVRSLSSCFITSAIFAFNCVLSEATSAAERFVSDVGKLFLNERFGVAGVARAADLIVPECPPERLREVEGCNPNKEKTEK